MNPQYRIEIASHEHIHLLAEIEIAAVQQFSFDDLTAGLRSQTLSAAEPEAALKQNMLWIGMTGKKIPGAFATPKTINEGLHLLKIDIYRHLLDNIIKSVIFQATGGNHGSRH